MTVQTWHVDLAVKMLAWALPELGKQIRALITHIRTQAPQGVKGGMNAAFAMAASVGRVVQARHGDDADGDKLAIAKAMLRNRLRLIRIEPTDSVVNALAELAVQPIVVERL